MISNKNNNLGDEIMSDRQHGTVRWFNNAKCFGFINMTDRDDDIFVHFRAIEGEGYRSLSEGQAVEFTLVEGPKGLQAESVQQR
jgi:CspA family cold shock protein